MAKTRQHELHPPNPRRGWSSDLLDLRNPVVVPPAEGGFVQQAGILHPDGAYCPRGALWRKSKPITTRPEMPKGPMPVLNGTWLWGGVLWVHFGHFVVESTGRLWALPQLRDKIDGILFMPKRPRRAGTVLGFQRDFVGLFGTDLPIRTTEGPTRVERLFVPGQGFGLGDIAAGTDPFRQAMAHDFAREVAPDGPKKLYVSRSRITGNKGILIDEDLIEARLAAEGYEIFHPQAHDLATQIARYRAADTILASEGSALHVVGMVAGAHQKIGILVRRRSNATAYIARQLESFSGRAPVIIDALVRTWKPAHARHKRSWHGEHHLPALQALLATEGFIASGGTPWQARSIEDIAANLGERYVVAAEHQPPALPLSRAA